MKPSPKLSSTENNNTTFQVTAEADEQIRRRAFEIYEQRGCEDGHDMDDWLRAETELTHQQTQAKAA